MFLAEDLAKTYGGLTAVGPLDVRIEAGERVAVVGPSGGGKTTLLFLLGGIIAPSSGRVLVAGRDPAILGRERQLSRLVGMIPQYSDLVPTLSVVDNVLAGCLGRWNLAQSLISLIWPRDLGRARAVLERVGIPDKLYERTSHLSGGEQQRVAFARVQMQDPAAILADEPVASLDPARARDLICLLTELAADSGKTLVASLHSVDLALAHFSRIVGLRRGAVLFDLPATDVTPSMLEELYDLRGTPDNGWPAAP